MMYTILGLICLSVLFVNATPILMIRDKFGLLDMKEDYPEWKNRIIELLSCCMCTGFWVGFLGLLLLGKPSLTIIFGAAVISIGSELVNKILRR